MLAPAVGKFHLQRMELAVALLPGGGPQLLRLFLSILPEGLSLAFCLSEYRFSILLGFFSHALGIKLGVVDKGICLRLGIRTHGCSVLLRTLDKLLARLLGRCQKLLRISTKRSKRRAPLPLRFALLFLQLGIKLKDTGIIRLDLLTQPGNILLLPGKNLIYSFLIITAKGSRKILWHLISIAYLLFVFIVIVIVVGNL